MDTTAQWPQGIGVVRAVETSTRPTERKPRPEKEQALNCPRCNSTNTKFCYYNNYSLSQPRYFCKTCRRYWTEGGTLRNVPVGGGSRKNKRPSSSSDSSPSISYASSSKKVVPDLSPYKFSFPNPKIPEGKDLNPPYNPAIYNGIPEFVALPFGLDLKGLKPQNPINPSPYSSSHLPIEAAGNVSLGGLSSLISMPFSSANLVHSSSSTFPMHDGQFKPRLNFSADGIENLQQMVQGHTTSSSRTLYPFEELKPVSTTSEFDEVQDHRSGQGDQASNNGYWNGTLAGGSW